jgi:decaprenylphospho-beta-D-ribofuranose 2-oxidase
MPLTRREFLLTASVATLEISCSAIPPPKCCTLPTATCPAPDPLPGGFPASRCEVFSFDEIHHALPTVYHPASEGQLATLLANAPEGRKITFRGGGQSMDTQSLNDDVVIFIDRTNFGAIGEPQRDGEGFYITVGAGARWWDVLCKVARFGLVPPSLVTAGDATVGGTLSSDCLSRMSPITGKEGQQIRSFRVALADGRILDCRRDETQDEEKKTLFDAVIGGFGYLGAVTQVTFDLLVARSLPGSSGQNPQVLTRSTRHGPNVDWDLVLQSLRSKSRISHKHFSKHRPNHLGAKPASGQPDLAQTPEWSALSIASFFTGSGMSANLLEQRFVEQRKLRPVPSGTYQVDSTFMVNSEKLIPSWPTAVELGLEIGFPEGEFIDELFGWAFFLGNCTSRAKTRSHESGNRLNFIEQSFALPAPGREEEPVDTRPTRRFLELLEARLHEADVRPAVIDFLYIPADRFLMSASRGLTGFVVTVAFGERNRDKFSPQVTDTLKALSHDCRTLGGRVHLVKGVVAERADLRAMHGDAAAELRKLKQRFDPKNLFQNEFFQRVFGE